MWTPIYLYLSGMWVGVDLRIGITMASCVLKVIGIHDQNMPTILIARSQHDWGTYMTT